MMIITSLSPKHSNAKQQQAAINSWQRYGQCYSLNSKSEMADLKNEYSGIIFLETSRTTEALFGKPRVCVNAMIDIAKMYDEDLILINSDIILGEDLPEFKQDGISCLSRYDYNDDMAVYEKFESGFDVFFIPKKFLNIFPPSIFALGMAWWDYFLPYIAMNKNIPVHYFEKAYAFHKRHEVQYSLNEWVFVGNYFASYFKIKQYDIGVIGNVATNSLNKIRSNFGNKNVQMEIKSEEKREYSCDIFYKTYEKDFKLLYYSLKSVIKNVAGYNRVIIIVPESEKDKFLKAGMELPPRTLIVYINEYGSGYLFQQVCKINAHKYSNADFILFADSDCIFNRQINLLDYIRDGKPEILYTDYNQLPDAKIWQEPTEKILGDKVDWEFMRRNCLVYHRATLINLHKWKPNLESIIMGSHRFSEFNLIGSYAYKYERNQYKWTNTDDWEYKPPKAEQLWSYFDKNGSDVHRKEYLRALYTINSALDLSLTEI